MINMFIYILFEVIGLIIFLRYVKSLSERDSLVKVNEFIHNRHLLISRSNFPKVNESKSNHIVKIILLCLILRYDSKLIFLDLQNY